MDAKKLVLKYVAGCGSIYDFFGMCWRGKKTHTPETLRVSQKRGTWIVSLFLFFAVIGAFVDEEENVQTEESFGGSDLGTGTVVNPSIRKDLGNPKSFKRISVNKSSIKLHEGFVKDAYDRFPNHFREDDGTAFSDAGISMKVYSVDDDGVLAGYGSNVVYVETPEAGYVDGSYLKAGVYVRNGTYRYTSADGACRTVPAFKKVTSEKDIQIFNAMSAYLVEVINENDYNSNKRMSCESWAIEN